MSREISEEEAEYRAERRRGLHMTPREERDLAQERDNAAEREMDTRWEQ